MSACPRVDGISGAIVVMLGLVGCGASVCCERARGVTPTGGAASAAEQRDKPPAAAGTGAQGMINVPVSTKLSVAPWPRAGAPDYTFRVHSSGGPIQGAGVSEFDWTLQIDARRSLVSVESFRYDSDLPAQPLGVFRMSIDDHALHEFRKLLSEKKVLEPHPPMNRHPGYTQREYTLTEPQRGSARQVINDSDEDTNAAIDPVPQKISELLFATFKHPERAALLGIKQSRTPAGDVFEVTVTNIGIERIGFTDPRWIVAKGPLHQAIVSVAEFPEQVPGESEPLDWKTIPLPPMQPRPAKEPWVVLDPGAVWKTTTLPWKTVPGKRYLAEFTLANYEGEPMVDGVYRIRGRADSNRLVIAP